MKIANHKVSVWLLMAALIVMPLQLVTASVSNIDNLQHQVMTMQDCQVQHDQYQNNLDDDNCCDTQHYACNGINHCSHAGSFAAFPLTSNHLNLQTASNAYIVKQSVLTGVAAGNLLRPPKNPDCSIFN